MFNAEIKRLSESTRSSSKRLMMDLWWNEVCKTTNSQSATKSDSLLNHSYDYKIELACLAVILWLQVCNFTVAHLLTNLHIEHTHTHT